MKKITLDRRTLLRGLLGGLAVSVALPTLDIFLDGHGEAYASGEGFPKRFGVWFWGNGVHASPDDDRWTPTGEGADFQLAEEMAPLAPVKSDITVISGLKVYMPNVDPHGTGPAAVLSATRSTAERAFGAPTLDQIIADGIGGASTFRSLELSAQRSDQSQSYSGAGTSNPPESSPAALFARLFGDGFRTAGDAPVVDPKLALRKSVLDAVADDSGRLRMRLGTVDRARLDQHFDGIRSLEQRIAKLQEAPPVLAACSKPGQPMPDYPDIEGRAQLAAVSRVMADLLAMALACDLTRVFSFQFCRPISNNLFPGTNSGHHQLTHDELGTQPQVTDIIKQIMGELAYFIGALRAVNEGDGTLLQHSLMLCLTDTSYGKSHSIDNYPVLLAGGASGAVKTGIHVRSPGAENACKLGFSLQRVMGLPVARWGSDEGVVTEGLPAIET